MSLYTVILQLDPSQLPPAVQWLVYMALAVGAAALLKRSVDKLDKSIERLELSITSISEKLIRLDAKFEQHETDIKELKEVNKNRRRN
jgi:membrane protein implicated in regulation of membrane protease activity